MTSGATAYAYLTASCVAGGSQNAFLSWGVPLGAGYEWILIQANGIGATTGTYSLVLDTNGDRYADWNATNPTWQDAFPVAANTGTYRTDLKGSADNDWFKVYVPPLTVTTNLVITYGPGTNFTPRTWIYTSAGVPLTAVGFWDLMTITLPVAPSADDQWYYVLVGSAFPSTVGTYFVRANLQVGGVDVDEDWSDPIAAARYELQFPWGDLVADTLENEDDGFEVTLARGDRMTIEVVPATLCDTKIEVFTPLLTAGEDAYYGDPFMWDDEHNGATGGAWGYGDSVTFVAGRAGEYTIDIKPGPSGGCVTNYVAYFHVGLDEPAANLPPPFDRTPD